MSLSFFTATWEVRAQGTFRTRIYINQSTQHSTTDIFEISPGSYFGGGIALFQPTAGVDIFKLAVVGLDAIGNQTWAKTYGNENYDFVLSPFSVRSFQKVGQYIYYAGGIFEGTPKMSAVLIKFDLNGDTVWQRVYRDPINDLVAYIVCPSVDGGFLLTGFLQYPQNGQPCFIIKTDSNGNELWRKILNKPVPDVSDGRSIVQDSVSKKILIVGSQYVNTAAGVRGYGHLTILDSLGNLAQRIDQKPGIVTSIVSTFDKKFVLAGMEEITYPPGPNPPYEYAAYVKKFDVNNPTSNIWETATFDGFVYSHNSFMAAIESSNGDILITGGLNNVLESPVDQHKVRIVRLSSSGTIKYKKYYNYSRDDSTDNVMTPLNINMTSDGGHIVGIRITNFNVINPLFYVKYDSTGCDSTIIYCLTDGAVGKGEITKHSGISVYPNPANENINVNVGDRTDLNLIVSDLQGRILIQQGIGSGTITIPMPLAKGLYLLGVRDGEGRLMHLEKILKE